MKCSRCGTDNPKGKNVCKKCGAFLYSNRPNNRKALTPQEKRERRKLIFKNSSKGCLYSALIFIGILVVLGVISYLLVRFVLPDDVVNYMDSDYSYTTSETTTELQN